jgi:peptide/nickel transport system substrate-binding protein
VQLQWPQWGMYYESKGQRGEKPALPEVQELVRLGEAWRSADTPEAQRKVWERILEIHAEQVYTIGIVGGIPQPVVVNDRLRNVPRDGIYAYDPGAHFGLYRMDTFWFDDPKPPPPPGPNPARHDQN